MDVVDDLCTADKSRAPDCYSYLDISFGTSEYQTPLYSEQQTPGVTPKDSNCYKWPPKATDQNCEHKS